jgi:catechol 2,3-dioxygenase-like lactoylglutathione lyase family enzyme
MLETLDHVIVAVRDLEAATRQYALLLGRTLSWRGKHPGQGTANTLFRLENTYLELLAPEGEGTIGGAVRAFLGARAAAPLGLAFGTRDAAACHARFAEQGLAPAPIEKGFGHDVDSGAFREWRRVALPPTKTRGVVIFAIEHTTPDGILASAGVVCDEAAAVAALDHAVVQTTDPEAARTLYGKRLGLRLALDRAFPQWGVRLLFFRAGGVTVEIAARLERPEERAPAALPAAGDGDRLWGLSWRVPDADAGRARLAEAGFDVSEVRAGRKPGTRVFSVREGACGIPTLFVEPPARSPAR